MTKFNLENFIKQLLYKYPDIKEFLKEKERLKWAYRPGIFILVDNNTHIIYLGSTYDLGKTIFHHVKKKNINSKNYRIIKQANHISLYIIERLPFTCGESFMKKLENDYFKQLPEQQRVLLSEDMYLWSLLNN